VSSEQPAAQPAAPPAGTPPAAEPPAYPPVRHLLRDLAIDVEHRHGDATSRAWLPVGPYMLDDQGSVRAGVLAIVVDVIGGGLSAWAAQPNWIATADLTLHLVRGSTGPTVQADARVLRSGRTTVVIEVTLRDTDVFGLATMTFSVLPRRDSNPTFVADGATSRLTFANDESGFTDPVTDALGITVVDRARGAIELPVVDYARNSLGSLQGGVVALGIEYAAEQALRVACGAPVTVTDLQVTYLALVRGTLRTDVDVLHAQADHGSAYVDVVDIGGESRRTTTGRVVATLGTR
jgi:uncharacterized protein (TIGR00369 family)